nr:Lrp/AsnC family transcriptional regulator [Spinactinospora alkalitolerans]
MLDELDLDLVAALQRAPRAPINVVADALGSSASTVGRRLQRLQAERLVRVIGQVDWTLLSDAHPRHLWVDTVPGRLQSVARRLAERPETQFVAMTSGRADVYCVVHPSSRERVKDLLTHEIPSVDGVVATQSDLVLRPVTRADAWRLDRLDPEALRILQPHTDVGGDEAPRASQEPLSAQEARAVRMLHHDARASSGEVARELGVSQSTAYRLVQSLLERRAVRPRVEVEPGLLGMELEAVLSLTAHPGSVADVADALGAHPSARYVSVVAGASSVIHHAVFRDEAHLADFLSDDLARIPGITALQVSVVLDVLRRYWIGRDGVRLEEPRPLPAGLEEALSHGSTAGAGPPGAREVS